MYVCMYISDQAIKRICLLVSRAATPSQRLKKMRRTLRIQIQMKPRRIHKYACKVEDHKIFNELAREETDIASKRTLNAARSVSGEAKDPLVCHVSKVLEMDRIG